MNYDNSDICDKVINEGDINSGIIDENPNECPICLLDYDESTKKQLECPGKHTFHIECIDAWLTKKNHCPLCRTSISTHEIISVPDTSNGNQINSSLYDIIHPGNIEYHGNLLVLTDLNIFGNVTLHRIPVDGLICINSLTITNGNLIIHGNLRVRGTLAINGSLTLS